MIERIRGKLIAKSPAGAVIEVGGIAFSMAIPLTTWERLGSVGSEATLMTYLHVREDILQLYGFDSIAERETFLQLIAVNGVGPKMGLAILSRFSPESLSDVIHNQDVRRFQTVPGVGKRTAERLMVELKGKFGTGSTSAGFDPSPLGSAISEAIRALETLGIPLVQADEAVRKAQKTIGSDAKVEELVKQALRGG